MLLRGYKLWIRVKFNMRPNKNLYQDKYRIETRRLKGRDYAYPGWYFITICTYEHKSLFGKVVKSEMILNRYGKIVEEEWLKSESIRKEIELNDFVVMPNHFHALIGIDFKNHIKQETNVNYGVARRKPKSISSLISSFKGAVTRRINEISSTKNIKVWQNNYYDHIVRKEELLNKMQGYIKNNPAVWERDKYYK